jgi:hypothetical protein
MQMLCEMILMIDPCNSNADLSKITTTDVFIYAFSLVPYSESNKEYGTGSKFIICLTFCFKMIYADTLFNDFND